MQGPRLTEEQKAEMRGGFMRGRTLLYVDESVEIDEEKYEKILTEWERKCK